jgi:hypothetical protein
MRLHVLVERASMRFCVLVEVHRCTAQHPSRGPAAEFAYLRICIHDTHRGMSSNTHRSIHSVLLAETNSMKGKHKSRHRWCLKRWRKYGLDHHGKRHLHIDGSGKRTATFAIRCKRTVSPRQAFRRPHAPRPSAPATRRPGGRPVLRRSGKIPKSRREAPGQSGKELQKRTCSH